jgi:hypothetical protein
MDKEIMDFNAQFNEELKEITIITETSPLGGAKGGAEKFYEINCGITAWKFINSDEFFTGEFLLTGKADYRQIKELQEKILPDSIISLKVRQRENAFLLVEIMENKNINEELKNILKEQTKPIIYTDETLGEFTLNKRFNKYTGKIKWNNKKIELDIEKYTGKRLNDVFIVANELIKEQSMWGKKINEFAVEKLLKLKNKSWLEEGEKEITAEQFIKKMKLESINVSLKNKFEFYFDDGELFWGHGITVYGNLEKGPLRAEVE